MVQSGRRFFRKRYEQLGGCIVDVNPLTCIRINTLRSSHDLVISRLSSLGVELQSVPFVRDGYYVVHSNFSVGSAVEFLMGLYYVQNAVSQVPVEVLAPEPGELVLDCCAAPGGKTTQIAQWMDNGGVIVAYELKSRRVVSLSTNLERCGVSNAVVFKSDVVAARNLGLMFDRVLLDAPCSGNYVSDRDWFNKRTVRGIERNAAVQRKLLSVAVDVLKPGGVLVYSVCSLEPEECELVMQWAIDNLPVCFEPVGLEVGVPGLTSVFGSRLSDDVALCRRFWPFRTNTEGFFVARLRKNA